MSNQVITIKWSIDEIGQYCSNVSAYVASTMAQDGNTFDIFTMTEDDNVTFLKGSVSEAILALTPFFNRITPDSYDPINNDVEVGLSFIPRIEGGDYSRTELSYVQSLCKRYIANYILSAWYVSHNANTMVSYFTNANVLVGKNITDALVRFVRPVRKASSSIRKVTYGGVVEKHLYHINNRSDFAILWRPKDNLPLPDFDYDLVFFTDDKSTYTVNSENSLLFKRITDAEGKVYGARIIFDFSQKGAEFFNNGVLKYKMFGQVPDADFPDGSRSFEVEASTDVEIWDGPSDTNVDMSVSYIPSYVKLTFQDLTEQDIQVLQEPALEAKAEWDRVKPAIEQAISDATSAIEDAATAIQSANGGASNANSAATQARIMGEAAAKKGVNAQEAADRANNIATTIEGNYNAKIAEIDAAIAEADNRVTNAINGLNSAVVTAETAIDQVEGRLIGVDNTLANVQAKINDSVAATNNANTAAQSANNAAIAANKVANDFNQAENARVAAEESREEAEGGRVDAENARVSAEKQRENLESGRKANETARQNAENAREAAEAKRQTDTAKAISDVKTETATALSNMQSKVDTAVGNANQATASATQAAQEANEAREGIEEALGAKADKDGNYPELAAGFAYEILGDGQATAEQFSFRPTGGPNRNVRDGSARIEVLKGNSVVWNQTARLRSTTTLNGLTFTNENNELRVSGTVTTAFDYDVVTLTAYSRIPLKRDGRKYLISIETPNGIAYGINGFAITSQKPHIFSDNKGGVFYGYISIKVALGETVDYVFRNPLIIDLTMMFGAGNEPATVEQFYEMLPEGVDINAYNEGEIVDANYKAIKTTGFNQWDEQWEVGRLNPTTGQIEAADQQICSVNYTKVLPSQLYFVNNQALIYFYDSNLQYLGRLDNPNKQGATFTTPANAAYLKFCSYVTYGTTYKGDICINIYWDEYSALNGTYKPYKPFERDLSWVAKYFPNGMRSAGNVADEIRFNSTTQKWEAVQNVGVLTLSAEPVYMSIEGSFKLYSSIAPLAGIAKVSEGYTNLLCKKYTTFNNPSSIYTGASPDKVIAMNGAGNLYIRDTAYTTGTSFLEVINGLEVYYELATPIVTEITEDVNLAYDIADYGTEQLIVAEGAQSAPLSADVVYEPNVLASIKQVAAMLTRLDALETAVATMQASVVATTNEE